MGCDGKGIPHQIRPIGDPHFWKEAAVVDRDTLWVGESQNLFVSETLWKVLNCEFPDHFHMCAVAEKDLS
jgi:hypothetical protein